MKIVIPILALDLWNKFGDDDYAVHWVFLDGRVRRVPR
jgi:hypothetical protein